MFDNVSRKIKTLIESIAAIFIILIVFVAFALLLGVFDGYEEAIYALIAICILIPIVILNCMLIYGFAKIVEKVELIAENTIPKNEQDEKLRKLEYWKEWNLITDKEYEILKNRLSSPEDMLYTLKTKYNNGEITEQQYKEMRIRILNNFCK